MRGNLDTPALFLAVAPKLSFALRALWQGNRASLFTPTSARVAEDAASGCDALRTRASDDSTPSACSLAHAFRRGIECLCMDLNMPCAKPLN